MNIREMNGMRAWTDQSSSEPEPVASSCEHGNEPSRLHKESAIS
jgi:hypothetical protein